MQPPCLYLITDRTATLGRELGEVVRAALSALPHGAAMVQLREKDLPARELLALANRLRGITAERGCKLLVNDRLDVALACGADGVHLPGSGLDLAAARAVAGPDFLIGVSTHSAEAASQAALGGADVIVCGPIWPTPSKAAYGPPLGLGALRQASQAVHAAATGAWLYALGGITTAERASQARLAGAHGMAGIRAFFEAADPGQAAALFYQACIARQ